MRIIYVLYILIFFVTTSLAQTNEWIETNTGIADFSSGETFDVVKNVTLENSKVLTFIENHTVPSKTGVYELNQDSWEWNKISANTGNFGFDEILVDGNRVFNVRFGSIREFNFQTGDWDSKIADGFTDNQLLGVVRTKMSIAEGIVYYRVRLEGSDSDEKNRVNPQGNYKKNEEYLTGINVDNGEVIEIRNPEKPLVIGNRGGNFNMGLALKNNRYFICNTFEYANKDGFGGFYEWDGTSWTIATGGLHAINITGSGFGPIGPIFTDIDKNRIFIRTEKGFYEKVDGGWIKYFGASRANYYITDRFLFTPRGAGGIAQLDSAIQINHRGNFDGCLSLYRQFITSRSHDFFLSELQETFDEEGNCISNNNGQVENKLGLYRYVPTDDKAAIVRNLHLETGTYLGGKGENFVAESAILNNGNVMVSGTFNSNMNGTVSTLLGASPTDKGKIYEMNEWGTSVNQTIVLGDAIYDMDVEETTGEIALLGDFGIAVLNPDYTLKWSVDANANSNQSAGFKPRITIAENGMVAAILVSSAKLYSSTGTLIQENTNSFSNGVKVHDIEIDSDKGQFYICGFTQANSNLQVAFVRAYPLTSNTSSNWKTWGFAVGGAEGLQLSNNGADTRAYQLKVSNDGDLYVAVETAGGGPGGFTILAYNGKDLSTKIVKSSDFYTNGTNSCGPCHITFIGRINTDDGVVKEGMFFHARLSNGKTNALLNKDGDLEVDEDGNVYLTGRSSARYENRDLMNINGRLIERYSGNDQFVLMTSPSLQTRYLWTSFPKANNGGGTHNRIAVGNGKVAYVATSTIGELMTTDNAIQNEPYNIVRIEGAIDTLSANDAYLATWHRKVWEYANDDSIEFPFIPADSCFRVDDLPCVTVPEKGQSPLDVLNVFNIISPNGDRINDVWRIDNLQNLESYQIRVFTSTGKVVYSNGFQFTENAWDGTDNGEPLPEGIYYYVIQVKGIKEVKSGYITLVY